MKTAAIILGSIIISHNLFSNDLVDIKNTRHRTNIFHLYRGPAGASQLIPLVYWQRNQKS